MIKGYSLCKSSEIVDVTWVTLFYWRHKILSALNQLSVGHFEGIVEVDETYMLYSEKGQKHITTRKPRKRGVVMKKVYSITTKFFTQTGPLSIGVWCLVSGLFSLLVLTLYYVLYAKKNSFSLKESGILPGWKVIGKTAPLALIVVFFCFLIVFFADYFFKSDFRLWVFGIKTFRADKVLIALHYLQIQLAR